MILSANLTANIRLSGNLMVNVSAFVNLTVTLSMCNNNNNKIL